MTLKLFLLAVSIAFVLSFTKRLATVRTDNAEMDLIGLFAFDSQPKADRIRISKAVMKARGK